MSELQPTHVSKDGAEKGLQDLGLAMCGGMPLQAYLDEFRAQGELQCTNVWSKAIIAYRCRTCQTNDSRYGFCCRPSPPVAVLFGEWIFRRKSSTANNNRTNLDECVEFLDRESNSSLFRTSVSVHSISVGCNGRDSLHG